MVFSDLIRYVINLFDHIEQKKIVSFLQKKLNYPIVIFDVGAHHGETISLVKKNFKIKSIHSFEASPENYKILFKKFQNINNIFINNLGLGKKKKKSFINQTIESSSSTINKINIRSKYLKRKKNLLSFFSKKNFSNKIAIDLTTADNYIKINKIKNIDLFKIDTEGYEYLILLGAKKSLSKIKLLYFEHHYDDMIIKNYKFSDVHNLLTQYGFKKVYKSKMIFRKTFEYIYLNSSYKKNNFC